MYAVLYKVLHLLNNTNYFNKTCRDSVSHIDDVDLLLWFWMFSDFIKFYIYYEIIVQGPWIAYIFEWAYLCQVSYTGSPGPLV